MKARDAWLYAVVGGLLIWWWFGRRNEVSIGAGVRIGGWVPIVTPPPAASESSFYDETIEDYWR